MGYSRSWILVRGLGSSVMVNGFTTSCPNAWCKNVFVKKIVCGRQSLLKASKGAVDAVWNLFKNAVHCSLATTSKGQGPNPLLMQYAQQWQWRSVQKKPLLGYRCLVVQGRLWMNTLRQNKIDQPRLHISNESVRSRCFWDFDNGIWWNSFQTWRWLSHGKKLRPGYPPDGC